MATFTYQTNAELNEIAQDKLPRLTQDRPIFELMPMEDTDASIIMWEQQDNYTGLQNLRGINGALPLIQQTGSKSYIERPGYYGEGELIDEIQLTERRQRGTFATPISVQDLISEKQDKLLQRRLDRIEWLGWTLLTTGQFSVFTKNNVLAHQGAYTIQQYTATVPWATVATATPLADMSAVQLLARGHSVNLGAQATAWVNRKTYNNLRSNGNAVDLYGRRTAGLGTANNLEQINSIFLGDDLPTIRIYDEGYLADVTGTFTPFIADATVLVTGKRPAGQPIAKYKMTRNANSPAMTPGAYMYVTNKTGEDADGNAPSIGVFDTHNGGPALYFPAALCIMHV
jgi:hypothetical protein